MPAEISFFQKVTDTKPSQAVSITEALNWIKTGRYNNVVQTQLMLRATSEKKERTELKKQLPSVTWSGTFSKRNKESLLLYSTFICIDIDDIHIDELTHLKTSFAADQLTYAVFTSPSGNGLKVIYHCKSNATNHETYFEALSHYIVNYYGVIIDEKCKDICRLCFLSFDSDIYINTDADLFDIDNYNYDIDNKPVAPSAEYVPTNSTTDFDLLVKCDEITRKTHQPVPGTYNAYIVTFSIFANRYGIDEHTTCVHLQNACYEHSQKETKASVKSTYSKFKHEAGIWFANSKKVSKTKTKKPANTSNTQNQKTNGQLQVNFWYEVENEKTGKIEYKFGYDDAIQFLHNNGFYRFPLDNDYYQFIHVKEDIKQVEVIQPIKIKDFFLTYLKSNESAEYKAVREMFRRGAKNYCSINLLEGLDYKKPIFKKDTAESAFVYFKNCYLEITSTEIKTNQYSSLDNYIWSKQVIDFNYTPLDYADSDFCKFVSFAILGAKIPVNELDDIQVQKIKSLATTIGYLLHRYKNPALTKAVVAVDKKLRTSGEHNGGTGKSLLSKALAKMLNVCLIDGKNFKFDSPFPFQKANIDTELINFNDVLKQFDFERLFGMITEEFTFEKKGKDSITLAFEDAPKFYISTNTTLKGGGDSNKRRQQIIEFDNFFNAEHSPVDEFGHMFFYDWDANEFSRFYTYMIDCIKFYLKNGLIDFPLENYEINKLIDTAGEEFIDYMNEEVLDQLKLKQEFDNKVLFDNYISKNKHREKTQIKTFNKNVKTWATINNLDINAHKNGERDKRGSNTYFTFTNKIC